MHQVVRPIVQLSEKVQEVRSKEFKNDRECFSHNISQSSTNEDHTTFSFNIIRGMRKTLQRKNMKLDEVVLNLLHPADAYMSSDP